MRPEYAEEWQYYYSAAGGNADLGRLQVQFDEYYQVLADNGVRVNYIEPPVPAIGAYAGSRTSSRSPAAASSSTAEPSCTGTGSAPGRRAAR